MVDPPAEGSVVQSLDDHLRVLSQAASDCLTVTLQNHRQGLGQVHQLDVDILAWVSRIGGPERDLLQAARRELAFAEYSVAAGLYRQAYSGLRLFLELSFAAVYFSANEFARRQWVSDRTDFSWAKALDQDAGVLSASFVREFAPTAVADAHTYASAAARCYRECSQFVHGKARTSTMLPQQLAYQDAVVSAWCDQAQAAAESVLYLLYARYALDVEMRTDAALQDVMISHFGHLSTVREHLDLAGD